jgi:hypothetical protein
MYGYVTRSVRLLTVALLLAGVAGGIAPVTAAAARSRFPGPAASFTIGGSLVGVAATSANSALAVGYSGSLTSPKALVVRWNGTAWKQVPITAPAGSVLSSVAATSASNAWAVGQTGAGKTLIERWNGTAWKQVASPTPGTFSGLSGVTAVSASMAWAVGTTSTGGRLKSLILRWNGKAWKQVPSPSAAGGVVLSGVAAASAASAWAVGSAGASVQTLILRWNGTTWKRVASPNPGGHDNPDLLRAVAAVSARTAWAVGCTTCATGSGFNKPLIERWNGKVWGRVHSPALGGRGGILSGVAATSAKNAWAVGGTETGVGTHGTFETLILRWNGKTWMRVPSPSPAGAAGLSGVAAVSARSAWSVGSRGGTHPKALILRWNGTAWK